MNCVLNLVFLGIICHKTCSHLLDKIKDRDLDVVQMGQNLEQIPVGRPEVRLINVAYNHIPELPDYIFTNKSYKSLATIELSQNKISSISIAAFRGLRALSSVSLSHNNLTAVDPYVFKFNPKLTRLDLSSNKLSTKRLQILLISPSLESLLLSQNPIEQLYEVTFMGLPNLKNLILEGNPLRVIASNSFQPLSKLQYLSLANTGVYRLSESMFNRNLPRILDLQDTPLGRKFEPPLRKLTNDAVKNLVHFNDYLFADDGV